MAIATQVAGTWGTDGVTIALDSPQGESLTFDHLHDVFESKLAATEAVSSSADDVSDVLAGADRPTRQLSAVVNEATRAVTEATPAAEPVARRAAVIWALAAVCERLGEAADEAFLERVSSLTHNDPIEPAEFRESAAFLAACLDATVTQPGLVLPHGPDISRRFHAAYYADRGEDERAREAFEAAIDEIGSDSLNHLWYARFHDRRGSTALAREYFESGFELNAESIRPRKFDPLVPALVRFVELLDAAGEDADAVHWCEFALDRSEAVSMHTAALDRLARRVETGTLPPAGSDAGPLDFDP